MDLREVLSPRGEPLDAQALVLLTQALMRETRLRGAEDVGHEFHGNQWTRELKDWNDETPIQASIGQVRNGVVEVVNFPNKGDDTSLEHPDVFKSLSNEKWRMTAGTVYWWDEPSAESYFKVEDYYAKKGLRLTKQVRMTGGTLNPRELRDAEDAGHEFHGNQWTGKGFSTKEEADKWGTKTQSWVEKMTPEEELALDYYTTTVGLNDKLRGRRSLGTGIGFTRDPEGKSGITETQQLEGLDKLFARPEAILKEDVVTYRAWMGSSAPSNRQIGSEFVDRGFTSTALVKSETEDFRTDPNTGRSKNLVDVEIRVPAGTRALYVGTKPDDKSWYANSSELLINRGTRYRVISTNYGRAKRAVLEVVR